MAGMEELIAKTVIGSGPWAILFWYVWKQKDALVAKVMAASDAREERIMKEAQEREERIMKEAHEREQALMIGLKELGIVKNDIDDIKTCIIEMKSDVKVLKDRGTIQIKAQIPGQNISAS